ncbi:fasciclin domain-containing protein [Flavobacteriaceae bacterium]|nr:fasciclin domain-containing protein [Flavobacteriaceae bacterium]MDA9067576.1 fasciclin domain-containing protein [Flavobacteriaceae bacterium]MDB4134799.1 fasciclin domain-containing protein [Flavobacteriaceae bacterium]MDC0552092.1 fasciclin domain-containing protein [Flavobacteriaceae bacterium]
MNISLKFFKLSLALVIASSFLSCDVEDNESYPLPLLPTITEFVESNPDLTNLAAALSAADGNLLSLLNNGNYTLLAPNNWAFEVWLGTNGFNSMDEVPTDILKNILLNHVISGSVQSSDLTTAGSGYVLTNATNTDGDFLNMYFSTNSGIVFNGVTTILNPDIAVSNGVLHVVDLLIELPTVVTFATTNPGFETLVTALTRDDLSEDLVSILSTTTEPAPFTLFAPTNEAFTSLLSELGFESLNDIDTAILESTLATHVVAEANVRYEDLSNGMLITTIGDDLTISVGAGPQLVDLNGRTANIIAVDIQAYNGVIHVIDNVMLPQL